MSHAEHVQTLLDFKDHLKIPSHLVPSTMLYAFVDHEIVGRLSLRHELNDNLKERGGHVGYCVSKQHRQKGFAKEMFRQSLAICKSIGLKKLLVTCDHSNEASWRVIESFGGSLENRIFDSEDNGKIIRRYWVDCDEAIHPTIEIKDKVVGYVLRQNNNKTEILVFDHDKKFIDAGTQVPAGSVASGEDLQRALHRELYEESGLKDLVIKSKIDQYTFYREDQKCLHRRHVYSLTSHRELPDSWTHKVTGSGDDKDLHFHFYWMDLESAKSKLSVRLGDSVIFVKPRDPSHPLH